MAPHKKTRYYMEDPLAKSYLLLVLALAIIAALLTADAAQALRAYLGEARRQEADV